MIVKCLIKISNLMVSSFGFYTISKKNLTKFSKNRPLEHCKSPQGNFLSHNILATPYYNPRAFQKILLKFLISQKKKNIFFLTDSSS